MILLIVFAFLAGVVTILSPCILPILPIILSSSLGGQDRGKSRPLGVVTGFIASFTFFTLFLSTLVRISGISADTLRFISVIVIAGFGFSLLIPSLQEQVEKLFSQLTRFVPQGDTRTGFGPGLVVGLSLGLLWTPCVGPILASVISLAITGKVTLDAFIITLAYSVGTALPMLAVMIGGQNSLRQIPWLLANTAKIQKAFGILMIATALAILTNVDRQLQTFILAKFPQYGAGLTRLEDIEPIRKELAKLGGKEVGKNKIGQPMFDLTSPKGILAPEIIPGGVWLNTDPLTLAQLRGKVVVIDFWTYSCINCQRTLPYLRSWWEKYNDKGLVIIGVHSPEFEFEKNPDNLRRAVADFKLTYPIVQDNNFATWQAFNNHYWPAKYFIDKDGYIRFTHFGEGSYDESEKMIQDLLSETGASGIKGDIHNPQYQTYATTPETYLGYGRMVNIASAESIVENKATNYSAPARIPPDSIAYDGEWTVMSEYASASKGSKLYLNFEAKEVYLVARPKNKTAKIAVSVDDQMQYFGEDNKNGIVTVTADRLYKLVNLPSPGRHTLKLEFSDGEIEVFAFTFG